MLMHRILLQCSFKGKGILILKNLMNKILYYRIVLTFKYNEQMLLYINDLVFFFKLYTFIEPTRNKKSFSFSLQFLLFAKIHETLSVTNYFINFLRRHHFEINERRKLSSDNTSSNTNYLKFLSK